MLKMILGIIVGFVVWSVLWVGSDAGFMTLSPWYRELQEGFMKAVDAKQPFEVPTVILFISLIRSVMFSVVSGYLAVLISKEQSKTTLILGILLLLAGLSTEVIFWHYLPVWYHFLFLFLLIPMTVFGGKLRKV